jgi:hypothetical protein
MRKEGLKRRKPANIGAWGNFSFMPRLEEPVQPSNRDIESNLSKIPDNKPAQIKTQEGVEMPVARSGKIRLW